MQKVVNLFPNGLQTSLCAWYFPCLAFTLMKAARRRSASLTLLAESIYHYDSFARMHFLVRSQASEIVYQPL